MFHEHLTEGDGRLCWCAPGWEDETVTIVERVGPFLATSAYQHRTILHYQTFYHRKRHGRPWSLLPDVRLPVRDSASWRG